MYKERPELLFPGEAEMIERWMKLESEGKELPTTYDPNFELTAKARIIVTRILKKSYQLHNI
mgnify:CR=1 FL=1